MTKRLPKLLIVDDEESFQLGLRHLLKDLYDVRTAFHGDEALAILKNQKIDIVLLDVSMRSEDEGLLLIPKIRAIDSGTSIVMSSGNKDFQTVREAMLLGAEDYIPKDCGPDELLHQLQRIVEKRELVKRQEQLSFEGRQSTQSVKLVGRSESITRIASFLEKVRHSQTNVIITGETGTGKEVVARLLRASNDRGVPQAFVAIDSSTIQGSMAESMLFGHEKGAFTGADQARKGAFEEADGGIIYFDEIGNMPLDIQAKLLRVIQEKEISRLGSTRTIPLEFRVICATNRNLETLIREGKFKEDLYQRLNVIPIHIPPLRERREDIADLAEHLADKNATPLRRIQFTEDALRVLQNYSWPGNIRELNNLIAYLTAVLDKDQVDVADLPAKLFQEASLNPTNGSTPPIDDSDKTIYDRMAAYERQILIAEFRKQNGNISKMAQTLGMDRSHLYTKLKTYGIFLKRENRSPESLSQLNTF